MRDYYQILQVPKDADNSQIRKQFRHLALRHHPDRNQGKGAGQFRLLKEAYDVLSQPELRQAYDQKTFGPAEETHFPFYDTCKNPSTPEQKKKTWHIRRRRFNYQAVFCNDSDIRCSELNIFTQLDLQLEETIEPSKYTVNLQDCLDKPDKRRYTVKIPGGLFDGAWMKVDGLGLYESVSGDTGDLFIKIRFCEHGTFKVKGRDISCEAHVFPWEAALGTTLEIASLDGWVPVDIPQGFVGQTRISYPGLGLYCSDGRRGDLHVDVKIDMSAPVNEKTRRLWSQLARASRRV